MESLENTRNGTKSFSTPEAVIVSILIRTKNEEKNIKRILDSLMPQKYRDFEIIIVDSGSTDKTLEIAKKYPVEIFKIEPEKFTYGFALNYGFKKAKGRYVVCLSADALPASDDWLETLIKNFNDDSIAAVMCKTLPWPDCNPFDRRGLLKKFNMKKQEINEGPPLIFSNADSAIRKDVWEKIRFDETLTGAEEYDWVKKVRELKYKIIYEPEAEVYHSHNETLKQIFRRQHRETYGLKVLKCNKYTSLSYILFDLVAGSIYDMAYVLCKRDSLKWFFFAPFRRLAINYGRFRSNIKKSPR